MRKRSLIWMLVVGLLFLLGACSGEGETQGDALLDGPHVLPAFDDGKDDNYISTNAREFLLIGESHFDLPEGFEEYDEERQNEVLNSEAQKRLATVGRAVRSHIERVLREANGGTSSKDSKFFTYFKNNYSEMEQAEYVGEGVGRVSFQLEFVGSPFTMSQVAPDGRTRRTFEVEVKDWNQSEGEVITVEIRGSESRDSFPRYNELFADGYLRIGMHFGGDYNTERLDQETAKWTVEYLLERGFENEEVSNFEELHINSPPFTRPILVEGREIIVEIYVYHSEMADQANHHLLSDAMKESFATNDIVLYSGHAGSGAGFILDYQPRYDIPAREFEELPLAEKYQIYVFDGCMTYRTYVDDIMKNPRKTFDNVDIVTTVNTTPFSLGYQVIHQLVYWFTLTDNAGNHFPLSWQAILRGVNTRQYSDIYYGVHGVDNNPQLNPHANEGVACTPCQADSDCGAGGNYCLGYRSGAACGVACTTDTACGPGYRCARLWDDPDLWYFPKQCVRRDYVCD